jgi:hypothetical protein
MNSAPVYYARTEDLVVQQFGNELLIYDRRTDVAHCLAETAALVWRACEGGATLDQLAASVVGHTAADGETNALQALAALEEKGLLDEAGGGVSRRHALRKMAGVGAGALLAPLVVSAAVPKSAEAFGSPNTCGSPAATGQQKKCVNASTFGTGPANTCCGPGLLSCPSASGTGSGGCYCGSDSKCQNCAQTGQSVNDPVHCSYGSCSTKGAINLCCCSGVCSSTTANKCG